MRAGCKQTTHRRIVPGPVGHHRGKQAFCQRVAITTQVPADPLALSHQRPLVRHLSILYQVNGSGMAPGQLTIRDEPSWGRQGLQGVSTCAGRHLCFP